MLAVRRSRDRGLVDHGWLLARHTFSFGEYRDREHMGFGPLRVLNEDEVAPGAGFDTHPHENMEIVTYVLSGSLRHDDSTGGGGELRFNDVQAMTAGRGLTHSERNASETEPLHLIQIWIKPSERDLDPSYSDRRFDPEGARNRLQTLAGPAGTDGALKIHQDATVFRTLLDSGEDVNVDLKEGRRAWIHVVDGELTVRGEELSPGDALATDEAGVLTLAAGERGAHALVFELP